jgi:TPR repeat protein
MAKLQNRAKQTRISKSAKGDDLFLRAVQEEEKGNVRLAFRLCLAGAKAGDLSCQVNVGNLYDDAKGTKRNRVAALYWYKRAYRRGNAAAASNIGIMWRNEGKTKRALSWFRKAVRLGDEDANLEIAKYYLNAEFDPARAIPCLEKVQESDSVCEATAEEAVALLKAAKMKLKKDNKTIKS